MQPETTEKVPIERLRLDHRNPRLLGDAEHASDEAIVARLYRPAGLDEPLQPISANGHLAASVNGGLLDTCDARTYIWEEETRERKAQSVYTLA